MLEKKLIERVGLPESVEQLVDYPGVVYNKHAQKEVWRFQENSSGMVASQTLNRNFASNTAEMQLEACLTGLRVTLLPIFVADFYLRSGELIELFPSFSTYPERGIYAMYPQNRYLSARTRLFIDWLSDVSKKFSWC